MTILDESDITTKNIVLGGKSKEQLLAELVAAGIELNDAARTLFASDRFTTLRTSQLFVTAEMAVRQLGFEQGATTSDLYARAVALGLSLAPMELGPQLRLQYQDQPEGYYGHPETKHRAPPGSITVASLPISDDEQFPKGFYLRRIKGRLWLRGYWCDDKNVWNPDDRLVFGK